MESLIQKITDGDYDGALDKIEHAVAGRRATLAASEADAFQPGTRVIVNRECRPTRYIGKRGNVLGPAPRKSSNSRPKVLVQLDGQERPSPMPPSIIDRLEDPS